MGLREVVLLLAAQQLAQAVSVYLTAIQPSVTNPYWAAGVAVGVQLANNVATGITAGLVAANEEFDTANSAESTVAGALAAIPPIS